MGQKPAKASGKEVKPVEETKPVEAKPEPKQEEPPKKEEPVSPKSVEPPASPLRVDMTQVSDGEKHIDKRAEGVKFNGAIENPEFKAEKLPENVDPSISPLPVGAVQGSLGSLMAATLGVKHEGKTTGLVKKNKPNPQDEEDRLYHINQGANKDLAKAFGEMVVASRLKKTTGPNAFVPPSAIAKEEATKREEALVDRTGIAEKIAAERAKKIKAEEEEREKKKAAETERKKAEMAEMKKKQEARAAATSSAGLASPVNAEKDKTAGFASPTSPVAQFALKKKEDDGAKKDDKKKAEDEAAAKKKKAEDEAAAKKKKAEEEAKHKKDEEAAKHKKDEEAAAATKKKAEEEAAAKKKEAEEQAKKAEEAKNQAEAEAAAAKQAAEDEAARVTKLNEALAASVEDAIAEFRGEKGLGVIIAGPPAAGKGTQCEFIKNKYGLCHISTGDLLREHVKQGSEVGKKAKAFMDAGKLVPDDVIIELVHTKMQEPGVREKGWLLDGFPRTKAQADALNHAGIVADTFVLIKVGDEILVERVVGRRLDPKTGKIYHMKFDPPKDDEVASRLEHRSDDTAEKIQVRIKQYHDNIAAIIDNYQAVLHSVEGNKHPVKVFKQIKNGLDKGLDKKGLPVPEINDLVEPPSPRPEPEAKEETRKTVTLDVPTPRHEDDFKMTKAEVTRALRRYTQQASSGADVLDRTMELFWDQADPDSTGHISASDIFEWVQRGIRIPVLRGKSAEEVTILLEQDLHGGQITKADFFKNLRDLSTGKRRPEEPEDEEDAGQAAPTSSTPRDSTSPGEGESSEAPGENMPPVEEEQAGDAPAPSADDGVPVDEGDAPPPADEPPVEEGRGSAVEGEGAAGEAGGEDAPPPADEEAPGE